MHLGYTVDAITHHQIHFILLNYRIDYVPHDTQRPTPHVPESYRKPEGDFDLLTSYTKDYPARKAELAKSFKGTHTNHVPTGEFRGNPTYQGKATPGFMGLLFMPGG